ncbi:MAG: cyclic nucleotide-binding domain-containing protein [Chloroflexi bacterium]|nr:cyclic nucleotide-binding domain-containing protein [Chloroflexota bacterium]
MTATSPDFSADLARFSIFRELKPDALRAIPVESRTFRRGMRLFEQGEPVRHLYLLLEGEILLKHEDERGEGRLERIVRSGEVFGRLELDVPEGQLGRAEVRKFSRVLIIDKEVLVRLRNQYPELRNQLDRSEVVGHLRATPFLAPLTEFEIKWLADIVRLRHEEPNQIMYEQGAEADRVFVLRQGRVRLEHPDGRRRWLSAGSVFGERAVLQKDGAARLQELRAITESECRLYEIPADDLLALTRRHPTEPWLRDPILVEDLLRTAPLFKNLDNEQIARLAGYTMQLRFRQSYRTVVKQNVVDDYYYILVRGEATAQETIMLDGREIPNPPVPLSRGEAFGEASLLLGEPARKTVTTTTPTEWLRLHRIDFALYLEKYPSVFEHLELDDTLRTRYLGARRILSWQQSGEIIYKQLRRHWIVLARNLALVLTVIILLTTAFSFLLTKANLALAGGIGLGFVACVLGPVALWIVLDYLNDYHFITSRRIAHQEKVILIRERLLSAPLEQIQQISLARGFWGRLLGYGHLFISTAADAGVILFDFLSEPEENARLLEELMRRAKASVRVEQQETIRQQLQDRLHLGLEERIDRRALLEEPFALRSNDEQSRGRLEQMRQLLGLRQADRDTLVWHRHWVGLLTRTTLPFLLALTGIVLLGFGFPGLLFPAESNGAPSLILMLGFVLFVIGAPWLWWEWVDWVNDTYTLTNEFLQRRVVKPLWFQDIVRTTWLERIQNVTYTKPNPLAYILDYGHVVVQTAAEQGEIRFLYVPRPDFVQAEIFRRMENYRMTQAEKLRREQKSDMVDWLETYHLLINEERARQTR